MQDKPAKNMIFSVAEIVSYLSVVCDCVSPKNEGYELTRM